jgi:hypothetical protein
MMEQHVGTKGAVAETWIRIATVKPMVRAVTAETRPFSRRL